MYHTDDGETHKTQEANMARITDFGETEKGPHLVEAEVVEERNDLGGRGRGHDGRGGQGRGGDGRGP